ncbi:PepSY-associated TM helix domain-containing protein [Membranihabitans maritimus]|uniref:PepSY-associated TM helix domain-containing protein n=1 Tax=Membranihabitans maritimus TaxID=2904244 RepID=UPI001F1F967B|nr:PepSY-associated TM helix domain-containing protein [Membranihabitans maritimus]
MNKRIYNIMFHTHTISGIIISALLFIIFFAGSIAFLRDEINAWERNEPISESYFEQEDFDLVFDSLDNKYGLYGRDISLTQFYHEKRINTSLSASKDTTSIEKNSGRAFFYTNLANQKTYDYRNNYSLGEFFYRLHFFAQLNLYGRSGYLISGFVAFFFLFVVLTGVIVHWNKIVSSFYVFRPKAKWKTLWTDAHVGLGLIGLPYQFMFAVTGAYLIIGYTVMLEPVKSILYDGDADKMSKDAYYSYQSDFEFTGKKLTKDFSLNDYVRQTKERWENFRINQLEIFNYGDENMHIKVKGAYDYGTKFLGSGHMVYRASDNKVIDVKDPSDRTTYLEGAANTIQRLHYGDFGGYGMKIIYFILGLVSCFVILSGVMIWLVARNKKNVPERKKKFNTWLVRIYLSICLSMYPITAITFIAVKLFSENYTGTNMEFIYKVFFWGWLAMSALLLIKRDNYFTNKICLFLGAIFGFLVPISNGITTGNWPWISFAKGYSQIFVVDIFWLVLSITALLVTLKLKRREEANKPIKKGAMKTQIVAT